MRERYQKNYFHSLNFMRELATFAVSFLHFRLLKARLCVYELKYFFIEIKTSKAIKTIFIILISLFTPIYLVLGQANINGVNAPKKVFAHYMVCNKTYGNGSVAGYMRDIKEAIEMGVDGFALNVGAWDKNYIQNTQNLFKAAEKIDTSFKLFFSADRCCGLSNNAVISMVKTYVNLPNYFRYKNRPFLSAFAGGGGTQGRENWTNNILIPLKNIGYNIYFVPYMFATDYSETPDYNKVLYNYNLWWKDFVNGFFYFGAAGLPDPKKQNSLIKSGEAYAKVFHDNKRTYMATVSPYYWGGKQKNGRRYFDYKGGEGLAAQWQSIIDVQHPEWVEMVTWNDWDEGTYFSPIDDINLYWPWSSHKEIGFYKTHKGFAELNKFYIEWYKNGKQPSINNDKIFIFYRTHFKDSEAKFDPMGPVRARAGDVKDEIYITTILKENAELLVTTGNETKIYPVGKGIAHTRVPFKAGAQFFEVKRKRQRVLYVQGEDIKSSIYLYNFNVYSISVSSKPH